jgi:hypothetical protein
MRWIAPSEKDTATATLEMRLWDAADQFRANPGRKSQVSRKYLPLYVAEFQFCYNNRENADIFGTAIAGC